jgi:hypothetical protein
VTKSHLGVNADYWIWANVIPGQHLSIGHFVQGQGGWVDICLLGQLLARILGRAIAVRKSRSAPVFRPWQAFFGRLFRKSHAARTADDSVQGETAIAAFMPCA